MGYQHLSVNDRDEIWRLHAAGNNPNEIAMATGRAYSTVAAILKSTGGVRPSPSKVSALRLSPAEREEISRGVSARETFAAIGERIGRSTSTVSREVARNGGRRHYRACRAATAAWQRARRPKTAKLSDAAELREVVVSKLKLLWSPDQIASCRSRER